MSRSPFKLLHKVNGKSDETSMRKSRSRFHLHAARLAGGTAAAQAVSIVVLPILTRLYSPADFGVLVIVQSIATVVAIFATGRYEYAIVSEKVDSDAWSSVWLVMLLSASVCAVLLSIGISGVFILHAYSSYENVVAIVLLSSLLIGVTGIYQAFYFWANRNEKFGRMSINGVVGAVCVAIISIVLGLYSFGALGLLIGNIMGQISNTALLAWQTFSERGGLEYPGYNRIARAAKTHADFPRYLILAGVLQRVSAQMHIFILSTVYGAPVAGSLGIYRRVIGVPGRLIGNAVRQVFRQQAAKELNEHGECLDLYDRATRNLLYFGLPISLIMAIFSPYFFPLIFGEEWADSGRFAQLLAPMFLFGFVTSPVSSLIFVGNRPKYGLILQVILAVLSISFLLIGNAIGGLYVAVFAFGIAYCIKSTIEFTVARRIAAGRL